VSHVLDGRTYGEVARFDVSAGDGVDQDAIAAYKRDGVICLDGAFGQDWLDVIESGIDEAMEKPGPSAAMIGLPGDRGSFYYDSILWKQVEPFRRFIFDSHAADLFWPLLESTSLNFYYDFLILKAAHCNSAVTPWHHDQSYYPLNGTKIINCWTALDPIPVETSLRFVRGSHADGLIRRAVHFDPAKAYPNAMMERPLPPDFDADPDADMITCAMQPGDTLVFNVKMFHCAPGNHLDHRRGVFSTNWAGDDVTYNDMAQESDPPQRGEGLVHGGPITCETFPLVRGSA
jgi:hypothetical protein